MSIIDLRSDTVTKPTEAMRRAMANAEVGDDVMGEDPTINRLEALAADMLGTEAAVFAPSGTQTNLLALLTLCQRGEEYIVGQHAHTYLYEGGGAAVLGSIQPQPMDFEPDGTLDLAKVEKLIKPDDSHFAITRLLCLENTESGKVLPVKYLQAARIFTQKHGLKLHLDGARLFNAAVHLNMPVADLVQYVDTVSICLSKGLGAPVGSILAGSKENILRARRWRKMLGGGMRQAGIIAAAGIYALENNIERLAEDHKKAEYLAEGLKNINGISLNPATAQTNMVHMEMDEQIAKELEDYLRTKDIFIWSGASTRLVTHMDLSEDDIRKTVDYIRSFFKK